MDDSRYEWIRKELIEFQRENQLKIIIAGYGGSKSIGTDNAQSDEDFYVIYDSPLFNDKKQFSRNSFDIPAISIEKVLESIEQYTSSKHEYPTCLHRTKEQEAQARSLSQYQREEYPRSLVFYTMLADHRWIFEPYDLQSLAQLFHLGLRIIDVLDFYYTKAYGNYKHNIKNKESVVVRKYLTVIQELLYCIHAANATTPPPMHIDSLLRLPDENVTYNVLTEINRLLFLNQSPVDKNTNLVSKIQIVDDWIAAQLHYLAGLLSNPKLDFGYFEIR